MLADGSRDPQSPSVQGMQDVQDFFGVARRGGIIAVEGVRYRTKWIRLIQGEKKHAHLALFSFSPFFLLLFNSLMDAGFSRNPAQILHETRSEERRVGKECVSTCRSRWSPSH